MSISIMRGNISDNVEASSLAPAQNYRVKVAQKLVWKAKYIHLLYKQHFHFRPIKIVFVQERDASGWQRREGDEII